MAIGAKGFHQGKALPHMQKGGFAFGQGVSFGLYQHHSAPHGPFQRYVFCGVKELCETRGRGCSLITAGLELLHYLYVRSVLTGASGVDEVICGHIVCSMQPLPQPLIVGTAFAAGSGSHELRLE